MIASEQRFPVVLFSILYMVALTIESLDEIIKCDHSADENFKKCRSSCCAVYYAVQGTSNVESVHEKP